MIHFEVIPLSLGVETNDGRFLGVIPRNTSVPFQADEKFFTSENDQREMTYAVLFLFPFSSFKCRMFKVNGFNSDL